MPKKQTHSAISNILLGLARILHLVLRNSLLTTLSRLKPLLQVIHITHVEGVLTPKKQTFSAVLNILLGLARIS